MSWNVSYLGPEYRDSLNFDQHSEIKYQCKQSPFSNNFHKNIVNATSGQDLELVNSKGYLYVRQFSNEGIEEFMDQVYR